MNHGDCAAPGFDSTKQNGSFKQKDFYPHQNQRIVSLRQSMKLKNVKKQESKKQFFSM